MRKPMVTAVLVMMVSYLMTASGCSQHDGAKLSVTVDPRIELLAVVQLLSGYKAAPFLITRFDLVYKQDALRYFARFKDHQAVRLFDEMSAAGFSFDAPPSVMTKLTNPPDLQPRWAFDSMDTIRAGGRAKLDQFMEALRDFSLASDFTRFYNEHQGFYRGLTRSVQDTIEVSVRVFEQYYGSKDDGYHIVLAPLCVSGAFAVCIINPDSSREVFSIGGPLSMCDGCPQFGSKLRFESLIWHEFGHSTVNPAVASNWADIEENESLFEPIRERMVAEAYGNWASCVNEHIVRAITARITMRAYGKMEGDKEVYLQRVCGFPYLPELVERLKAYERDRGRYATIESFIPELATVFDSLSHQKLEAAFYSVPFEGAVSGIIMADARKIVFICPTHERDTSSQAQIVAEMARLRDNYCQGAVIITDDEANRRPLTDTHIIAFGTVNGNTWLGKNIDRLPIEVLPEMIISDSTYIGEDLKLVAVCPNPQNPSYGMLFYTALKAVSIVGMTDIGGVSRTDYAIIKGNRILHQGDFRKNRTTAWSL